MDTTALTRLLHVDAAANVAAAIGVAVFASALTAPLGIDAPWPVLVFALILAVNGVENHLVARRPSARGLTALIAIDVVFAVVALAFAVLDPTGADTWLRWTIVGVADLGAAAAIAKWFGLRSHRATHAAT